MLVRERTRSADWAKSDLLAPTLQVQRVARFQLQFLSQGLGDYYTSSFIHNKACFHVGIIIWVDPQIKPIFAFSEVNGTKNGVMGMVRLGFRRSSLMERVLVTGASGPIGKALLASLESQHMPVVRMVRGRPQNTAQVSWDPMAPLQPATVSGFDAVVHLAGERLVGRWTAEKQKAIRESRINGTRHLAVALAESQDKPRVFVCASAIGYYGNRGEEILREESASGQGFLADVCREWEDATRAASDAGIRTVNMRTGLVLSAKGGALGKMLPPFKLGLGGRLGCGRQWSSWIHVDDIVGGIQHAMRTESLAGPVNFAAPNPLRNAEFTRVLASVLRRPAFFPCRPWRYAWLSASWRRRNCFSPASGSSPVSFGRLDILFVFAN